MGDINKHAKINGREISQIIINKKKVNQSEKTSVYKKGCSGCYRRREGGRT